MKNSKRFLAMMTAGFLAITPMAATGLTAYAVTHSLTVTDTDTTEHTYTAYPIILGTKNTDGSLTGLSWGTGVNSTNLISALSTNASELGITISTTPTPTVDDVAAILAGITDADKIEKLAKILNDKTNILGTGTSLTKSGNDYSKTVDDGWYLVVDETSLASGTTSKSTQVRSANLLQVVGDITVNAKHSLPTLDKVIVDSGEKEVNSASIGDTITYHIKTKVPDMTGYNKYFFIVEDTLSAGLTYNGNSINIKVYDKDDSSLKDTLNKDEDTDYTNYASDHADYYVLTGGTPNLKIVFEDVINNFSSYDVGDDIVIEYTATLNNDAVINGEGNPNTAQLKYSNDPNVTYTPDASTPDEPGSGAPVGQTPPDTVKTYSTSIVIDKYELGTSTKKLSGVKFRISGTGLKSVQNESGLYVKNASASPAYYLLTNGTYTNVAPASTSPLSDGYASADTYAFTTALSLTGSEVKVDTYGETDSSGALTFSGLSAGTYIITEVEAKDGYNLLDAPITVEITETFDQSAKTCSYKYSKDGAAAGDSNTIGIANAKGSTLPTTGGIGTKLFYIIGGLLVAGSVVLLVTKKRMKTNED